MATVTIGMPIRNEATYLARTFDSLLGQDLTDFELVISDNASDDGTEAICRQAAARDARIRYQRHPVNIGAAENFNSLARQAQGKYFMWAAGHDLWHPSFLSRHVAAMEADPELGLVYPRTQWVDESARVLSENGESMTTQGLGAVARFNTVLWGTVKCTPIYGLLRTSVLRRTHLFPPVYAGDLILLAELSCYSKFLELPEALFMRRMNRPAEERTEQAARILELVRPASQPRGQGRPYLSFVTAFPRMVWSTDLSLPTRLTLLASLGLGLSVRYGGQLAAELAPTLWRLSGAGQSHAAPDRE